MIYNSFPNIFVQKGLIIIVLFSGFEKQSYSVCVLPFYHFRRLIFFSLLFQNALNGFSRATQAEGVFYAGNDVSFNEGEYSKQLQE